VVRRHRSGQRPGLPDARRRGPGGGSYGVGRGGGVCEPITIPMCQGLAYNQTVTPNLLGHTSQREAVVKMSFFNAMVQSMCSEPPLHPPNPNEKVTSTRYPGRL
uniref:FZ domain-containing protein n=1 Tax=Gasterosteus aculeatus aculeatus TaxID=481459 RepID=A0AAQ4QJE1_GASAC